jgi:hypothetical protein
MKVKVSLETMKRIHSAVDTEKEALVIAEEKGFRGNTANSIAESIVKVYTRTVYGNKK